MRYLAIALIAMLVAVPTVVAGGPDALSIAKRALRLAKEPPKVAQVERGTREFYGRDVVVRVRCPRGMKVMGVIPESGGAGAEFLSAGITGPQGGYAVFRMPESFPPLIPDPFPSIVVTCIEG